MRLVIVNDFRLESGERRAENLLAFTKHDCAPIICPKVGNLKESNPGSLLGGRLCWPTLPGVPARSEYSDPAHWS